MRRLTGRKPVKCVDNNDHSTAVNYLFAHVRMPSRSRSETTLDHLSAAPAYPWCANHHQDSHEIDKQFPPLDAATTVAEAELRRATVVINRDGSANSRGSR
jgi:hypothetical protein